MNKQWWKVLMAPVGFSVMVMLSSCSKDSADDATIDSSGSYSSLINQVKSLPKEPLSEAEKNSLFFMREEEKLARDVYTHLYGQWNAAIFNNIAASEQVHMDAVLQLLQKYQLNDPAEGLAAGVFTQPALQELYNSLISTGDKSNLAAMKVGAGIEDLDLFDLDNALKVADNQDIRLVYGNLAKGSRNHLRSFYERILAAGATYTPQYISQETFDQIVNSPKETGF